jgi:hypothetical protein
VLGALGRWGHDWAWSAPRESEAIDIGAIFRIAPGLIDAPARTSGSAEFAVQLDDATTKHYTLTIRRGEVSIAEAEQADADVVPIVIVSVRDTPGRNAKVFTADNGSVWIQTDSVALNTPDTPFDAQIKKGMVGSFFLVPANKGRAVRVRRAEN